MWAQPDILQVGAINLYRAYGTLGLGPPAIRCTPHQQLPTTSAGCILAPGIPEFRNDALPVKSRVQRGPTYNLARWCTGEGTRPAKMVLVDGGLPKRPRRTLWGSLVL